MTVEDTMIAIGADLDLELVSVAIGTGPTFALSADDAIDVARGLFLAANRIKNERSKAQAAPQAASPAAMKLN